MQGHEPRSGCPGRGGPRSLVRRPRLVPLVVVAGQPSNEPPPVADAVSDDAEGCARHDEREGAQRARVLPDRSDARTLASR